MKYIVKLKKVIERTVVVDAAADEFTEMVRKAPSDASRLWVHHFPFTLKDW